jgi:flagellar hook assembly protein FlgD
VEIHGDGAFSFALTLVPGRTSVTAVGGGDRFAGFPVRGPYPSPTASTSTMAFTLPEPVRVTVEVLDIAGRRVRADDLGTRGAGEVALRLEARDASGRALPSGVYFVKVRAGALETARKWVVVR